MNWEAVGAVGEIVGALAVMASLLYLATQVRQHARELRSAASDAAVNSLVGWLNPLFQNRDTRESLHLKHEMGVLDPGVWEGWSRVLHSFNQTAGLRAYFDHRRPAFGRSFAEWMDSEPEQVSDLPSMEDLVRQFSKSEPVARLPE